MPADVPVYVNGHICIDISRQLDVHLFCLSLSLGLDETGVQPGSTSDCAVQATVHRTWSHRLSKLFSGRNFRSKFNAYHLGASFLYVL